MYQDGVFKYVILALMVAIVVALGYALFFMLFKHQKTSQTVQALTFRIGLSLSLFIVLFVAFAMGWIRPHGLMPIANTQTQTERAILHPQNANTMPLPQRQNDAQE